MTSKLTIDELVEIAADALEYEYGGWQEPAARRVIARLGNEGVFDPSRVEEEL